MASKIKLEKWEKSIIHLHLNPEIYPNKDVPDTFLLVNKAELNKLIAMTKKRIKYYNKNIKPKNYAGYSEYGKDN